tara:strand:+ start:480 stop:1346 length:867 start_codon:yes stop_codon:yes gene_type:complete
MILKTSFKYLFILLAGMALVLNSCKEDCPSCQDPTNPDCENYDPCWDKIPVSADFEMSTKWPVEFPDYIGQWHPDVRYSRGRIGFRPNHYVEGDSTVKYTWLLGSEVIHDYTFVRNFIDTKETGENNIRITLIVEKEPDLECFPLDNGKDTVVKYIQFVDSLCEYLVLGDFKVLYDGDQDSVIIKTRNWKLLYYTSTGAPITDYCGGDWINSINLDDKRMGDTVWHTSPIATFYSKMWFIQDDVGPSWGKNYNGFFEVNPVTWECNGEFQIGRRPLTEIQRFKGRKIR